MLFKATSVYYSGGCAPPPLPSRPSAPKTPTPTTGGCTSWILFNFRVCSAGYLSQKKTIRGKGKGPFYSSEFFPSARADATNMDAMEHSIPVMNPGMEFDTWDIFFTITDVHASL